MPLRLGLGYKWPMGPVISFRRRSVLPITLGAIAAAALGFAVTTAFLHWKGGAAL
jgi:endonuclease YncB( thermonuclease family)